MPNLSLPPTLSVYGLYRSRLCQLKVTRMQQHKPECCPGVSSPLPSNYGNWITMACKVVWDHYQLTFRDAWHRVWACFFQENKGDRKENTGLNYPEPDNTQLPTNYPKSSPPLQCFCWHHTGLCYNKAKQKLFLFIMTVYFLFTILCII